MSQVYHANTVCLCFYLLSYILVFLVLIRMTLVHNRNSEFEQLQAELSRAVYRRVQNDASSLPVYSVTIPGLTTNTADQLILGTTFMLVGNAVMTDVLRGAHVVLLGDSGRFYEWIIAMQGSYRRTSSHVSTRVVYAVSGTLLPSCLAGMTPRQDSWFQLEADPWNFNRYPVRSLLHALSFLFYELLDVQVGPYGTSQYSETNPLIVRVV